MSGTGYLIVSTTTSTPVLTESASATAQSTPADPANTTSTSGAMAGLAGSFTPTATGKVLILISGDIRNSGNNDGAKAQIRYGTGAAPSNAAALTGSAVGGAVQYLNTSNNTVRTPFALNAVVTGLTIGTAYWLDIGQYAVTAGTASISNVSISAIEVK